MVTTKEEFVDEIYSALGQANIPNRVHVYTGNSDVFFGEDGSKIIRIETSKGLVTVSTDGGNFMVKHRVVLGDNDNEDDVEVGISFDEVGHGIVRSYLGGMWYQLP